MKSKDIKIGSMIGQLIVMENLFNNKIKVKCCCGVELVRNKSYLLSCIKNNRNSCCKECNKNIQEKLNTKHGFRKTKIYKVFEGMKDRCYKVSNRKFKYYGGNGIKICNEWFHNPTIFYNWALDNGYKEGLTIHRKDSKLDYCPENCVWADYEVQNNERGEYNNIVQAFGESKTISRWSKDERCVVSVATLGNRINKGWNSELSIITPANKNNRVNGDKLYIR